MVTTPLKHGSGHALPAPQFPFPLSSPTHHTYHQRGGTRYLSNGMQIKLSVRRASLPEAGRRDQVKAEEHNFCVSESQEEELIYIRPTRNEVKAQRWQWQFDWRGLVQKHWGQGPSIGVAVMLYRRKKVASAGHMRLVCMHVTRAEGGENKQVSCHTPWNHQSRINALLLLHLKH